MAEGTWGWPACLSPQQLGCSWTARPDEGGSSLFNWSIVGLSVRGRLNAAQRGCADGRRDVGRSPRTTPCSQVPEEPFPGWKGTETLLSLLFLLPHEPLSQRNRVHLFINCYYEFSMNTNNGSYQRSMHVPCYWQHTYLHYGLRGTERITGDSYRKTCLKFSMVVF